MLKMFFLQQFIYPRRAEAGGWLFSQRKLSVLPVRGAVTMTHSKNSILLLKHRLSIIGTGILNIGKLKLSITLIKSTSVSTATRRSGDI